MNHKSLSLSAIFKDSFSFTKQHFFVVLGLLLGYVVVCIVLETLSTTPYAAINFIVGLISLATSLIFLLGLNRILLDVIDGSKPLFSAFAREKGKMLSLFAQQLVRGLFQLTAALPFIIWFIVTIISAADRELAFSVDDLAMFGMEEFAALLITLFPLLGFATKLLGALLLLLPIYVSVRFMYAPFVLIDEAGSGAISSLRRSWQLTKGNVRLLIVLCIMLAVLNLLGILALLIGVLFTLVLSCFVGAVSYRMLSSGNDLLS